MNSAGGSTGFITGLKHDLRFRHSGRRREGGKGEKKGRERRREDGE